VKFSDPQQLLFPQHAQPPDRANDRISCDILQQEGTGFQERDWNKIASAARAVSSSSSGPESNGIARRKNYAVKARFSSVGKASNASSNWLVWRLITLSLDQK
jgi:hypothetical protein